MNALKTFDPLHKLDDMTALISELTGEDQSRVAQRLENERIHPGTTVAEDFAAKGGPRYVWGKHLEEFYGKTQAFLYELAVWNRNSLKAQLRRWTTRHMARQGRPLDVLGVGDGLGFDCLHFHRKKHRVTYFELAGISEQFARKLFERTHADIRIITDPASVPAGAFDVITCFDVLEHVPDPVSMVKTLASWLKPGGILYVSAPFFMILPWYPTHLRSNRRFSGSLALYRQAGLRLAGGVFTWYPLALQKPADALPGGAPEPWLPRLTAIPQMLGRFAAWPFYPVHLLRRINSRAYESREIT